MKIPRFLNKMLSDDDDMSEYQEQDPIRNPNYIPVEEDDRVRKKNKKRKQGVLGLSNTKAIIIAVVALLLIVSLITLPNAGKKKSTESLHKYATYDEAVVIDGMEFSIAGTSASTTLVGDENGKMSPAAGNTYYIITFNVKNVGNTSSSLEASTGFGSKSSRYAFTLIYENNYAYSSIKQSSNDALLTSYDEEVIPLQSVAGNVAFEVPLEVTTSDAALSIRVATENRACTWIIRDAQVPETTEPTE